MTVEKWAMKYDLLNVGDHHLSPVPLYATPKASPHHYHTLPLAFCLYNIIVGQRQQCQFIQPSVWMPPNPAHTNEGVGSVVHSWWSLSVDQQPLPPGAWILSAQLAYIQVVGARLGSQRPGRPSVLARYLRGYDRKHTAIPPGLPI